MGIQIPTRIRPFSRDFQEIFVTLAEEVNRLTSGYAELVKSNKQVFGGGGVAGDEIVFFKITGDNGMDDHPSDNQPLIYTGEIIKYAGVSDTHGDDPEFEFWAEVERETDSKGVDVRASQNLPIRMPITAEPEADKLSQGTIVMAQRLTTKTCIFSSVMPRLSVDCVESP